MAEYEHSQPGKRCLLANGKRPVPYEAIVDAHVICRLHPFGILLESEHAQSREIEQGHEMRASKPQIPQIEIRQMGEGHGRQLPWDGIQLERKQRVGGRDAYFIRTVQRSSVWKDGPEHGPDLKAQRVSVAFSPISFFFLWAVSHGDGVRAYCCLRRL